jgi:peptidoglycan/xylan/chitin deacetylase (PgdA/CDA1 family)
MGTLRSFMFHDVRDLKDTKYPKRYELKSFLQWDDFKERIRIISNRYKVISSDTALRLDLSQINGDYATLTFDDGLADHYEVYKYLNNLGLCATFLVPRAPIMDHKMIHSHKIQFLLASVDEKELVEYMLNDLGDYYGMSTKWKDGVWVEYSKSPWKDNWWSPEMVFVTNVLRKFPFEFPNTVYEYTDILFRKYVPQSEKEISEDLYLSERQLRVMAKQDCVTIGGHGDSSENLENMAYRSACNEIKKSCKFISKYSENIIFSYPNGGYNKFIKKAMENEGCKIAYTIEKKTITDLDEIDYLEFPRYDGAQVKL